MNPPIILPSAGLGTRLGSQTNKLNIKFVDNERLWEKQQQAIQNIFPDNDIFYITGFRADTVDIELKRNYANIYHNWKYEKTNVAYSINIALNHINHDDGCWIMMGDLWFDKKFLKTLPIPSGHSFLILDNSNNFDKKEIGVNIVNHCLDYAFEKKWSQICYLSPEATEQFQWYMQQNYNTKKYCFEIINKLIQNNYKFMMISCSGNIIEIDRQKDINKINEYINNA